MPYPTFTKSLCLRPVQRHLLHERHVDTVRHANDERRDEPDHRDVEQALAGQ